MKNILGNHYTVDAITALCEFAGQVVEVAYDPIKPQTKEYVRVKVKFDVSKPLRRSKIVNLPKGGTVTILYDYERIHKRCYTCQRLLHEQDKCPIFQKHMEDIFQKQMEDAKGKRKATSNQQKRVVEPVIKENDSLRGVLNEK